MILSFLFLWKFVKLFLLGYNLYVYKPIIVNSLGGRGSEKMSKEITVIGSINMDLVVKSDEIPRVGETLIGNELLQIPGGKGANQAVAIAKLERNVNFLGMVGSDSFGDTLLTSMKCAGVNTDYIERTQETTGIAVINVDKQGNNNILVIPGANNKVDKDYLQRNLNVIEQSDIVVFQLEIPLGTVKEGLKIAKSYGKTTILNPAPAYELDEEIIKNIDILIPNEFEMERLTGIKLTDEASMLKASRVLLEKGIKKIIVTLGAKGVLYVGLNGHKLYPAFKVKVVDTTAAGDSFVGGFAASYLYSQDIDEAIMLGQKTAAISIQRMGAQSSLPTLDEVTNFIHNT